MGSIGVWGSGIRLQGPESCHGRVDMSAVLKQNQRFEAPGLDLSRFKLQESGFRIQGVGCAGEVARSGVKRPWPRACVACKRTVSTHTTCNKALTLPACMHDA